jgi:hypothetical protein
MAENNGGWGERCNDQPGSGVAVAKAEFFHFHADAASTSTSSGRTMQASSRVSAGSTRGFTHCNKGNDCRRRCNCLLRLTTTNDDEDDLGRGQGGEGVSDPTR